MARYTLHYTYELRDPGHTVWSCGGGSLEGELEELRGLGSALQVEDLWEDITDAAGVIEAGDAMDDCFTVRFIDEDNFRLDMSLEKVKDPS